METKHIQGKVVAVCGKGRKDSLYNYAHKSLKG